MEEDDILHIHEKILKYFSVETDTNYNVYIKLIQLLLWQALNCIVPYGIINEKNELETIAKNYETTEKSKKKIPEEITYREYKNLYEFVVSVDIYLKNLKSEQEMYNFKTMDILEKYKIELTKPKVSTFRGTSEKLSNEKLQDLVLDFNSILEELKEKNLFFYSERLFYYLKKYRMNTVYTSYNPFEENNITVKKKKKNYYCKCFEKGEDTSGNIICKNCGKIYNELEETVNYSDYSRVNITQRYHYEKRCHFRDTINQYQGKQNKYIPQKVFDDVEYMIEMHGLKLKNVSIKHIGMFLSETKNSKYYEDKQLIYSIITKKEKPDISKYEKKLFEDFEKLVEVFLKIKGERKNFLHAHYVLTQLLLRQSLKLPENSLNSLRTPARLREHDDIYQKCCDILGWNFIPLA
jgi:hypothetical protein